MGVRRLQTYLESHCPESCYYEVDIEKIACEFRSKNQREPVIVVDGSSCFKRLYGDLDWVCGGQYKEYVNKITKFIDAFEGLGVKLVLYFDGPVQEDKRSMWVRRRLQRMEKAQDVVNALKSRHPVEKIDNKEKYVLPTGAGDVMYYILSTRRGTSCIVRRSIQGCDDEISSYAEEHKCLAILAQDTDYVIYNHGAKYYLSLDHLDLEKMTTRAYDKIALARHLKLDVKDLPVFATLMGNDYTTFDDLKNFHFKLTGNVGHGRPYVAALVPRIATYVRNLPKGNALLNALQQVSQYVFRTSNRSEDLRKSILSYGNINDDHTSTEEIIHTDENWNEILSIAHKNYVGQGEMISPPYIYTLLRELPFEMSTALEDFECATLLPSAVVLGSMRKRIYGVVLRESPSKKLGNDIIVKEWCASGPNSLAQVLEVSAILPPDDSPNLLSLWRDDSLDVKAKKFKLMGWMASAHLFSINFDLNTYPHQIVPAICILSYLYHDEAVLRDWEVKVFAKVVVEVQAMESKELEKIIVTTVDVRGVQLATLFSQAITHFALVNSICGNPLDTKWTTHHHLFDGKLFQSVYLTDEKVPSKPRIGSSVQFDQICEAILTLHYEPRKKKVKGLDCGSTKSDYCK